MQDRVQYLCSPNAIACYDRELYNKYKETCEDYITSKISNSLIYFANHIIFIKC